jgi:tRNA(Ile)-lysidine synthase
MDLSLSVKRLLLDERLIHGSETVIIAVSGGPDSMVLLHVMHRIANDLQLRLVAAHMNHGFRPEESASEADIVREFAGQLDIAFEYVETSVPDYANARRMNAQAAAREVRYRFLFDTADKYGSKAVLLAHHLDDQAETILMHLLSGAALTGLSGMPLKRTEKNMQLIRPLLRIDKNDILAYALEYQVPYCIDSSNISRKYDRNRLRLDVIPPLRKMNPQLSQALGRMADILRPEDAYMHSQALAAFKRIVRHEQEILRADREAFILEPLALQRRLIKLILNYLSEETRLSYYDNIESVRKSIISEYPPSIRLSLGAEIHFSRVYDQLSWQRVRPGTIQLDRVADRSYAYELSLISEELELPEAGGVLRISVMPASNQLAQSKDPNEAIFDADGLSWPLTVRSRANGDRMEPIGVNGSKKVKDIFIDLKIEPQWRDRVPLLVDSQKRVLWIPGIRRSGHALVSTASRQTVLLRFEQTDNRL